MRKRMVVLFTLGLLSGAIAVMMSGCNAVVGFVNGSLRDARVGWEYAKDGEKQLRKLDQQLNQ